MDVQEALQELGGYANRSVLLSRCSRAAVDRALREGLVLRLAPGVYGLPTTPLDVRAAIACGGVLSLTSAAIHHGWEVLRPPLHPHVTVPKHRRVRSRSGIVLHRCDLLAEQVSGPSTSTDFTLDQCLRQLPWPEALAVADSALRSGVVPARLRRLAVSASGPGARQLRRVAALANPDAANPFESALRALCNDIEGLQVVAQKQVHLGDKWVRPDLVDPDLMVVIEADSFEWHGSRTALHRDTVRYDELVRAGWIVLRFSWESVMFEQEWIKGILTDVVRRRTKGCPHCHPAA